MRRQGGAPQGLLTALAAVLLTVIVAAPFLFIALQAIFPKIGAGSLAAPFSAMADVLSAGRLPRATLNTLIMGVGTVIVSALIAVPLAAIRALYRLPGAALWDVIFLVPFMIPPYIATLSWVMTGQPRGYLEQLTGQNIAGLLFSVPGIVIILALHCFPVVYFALSRSFAAIGGRFADVSRVFGAGPLRAFLRVTLPLALPGLAASLILVFAMAIEEYGTPAVLGTRIGFRVLVTGIDEAIGDWPVDLPGASTLALVLVAMATAAYLAQRRLLARGGFETTGSRPLQADRRPLGRATLPALLLFGAVALVSTGIPLLAVLATALAKTISGGLAPENLGLQNFTAVLATSTTARSALLTSLGLGLVAALLTGLLGAFAAFVVLRTRARGRFYVDLLAALPNAAPGVVVALGMILLWNQPWWPITPYNTLSILVLAYVLLLLPQPVRYTTAALQQIAPSLDAAARVSGASELTMARRILLPLIGPHLLVAMLLVFVVAARELVASLLILPVGHQTIATFIWRQFDQGSVGLGMAMAFVTICLTTLLPLVVLIAARRTEDIG
ncbi:iron(III) transport system permease protein [Rhodobacter aestuarii]|uniref:Iron(III) transport system permease protein n=1 Tax=Rhodobacter aestuarii TaxID=453582 RepID=A0A1N7IXC3_9RHOB|nr:iron ABC transporter permease [Rhodobacter aestuarii]PTV97434.1 iron(III) transport system permease protein [Rhodobacter aestuarii]SIS41719.1 iron(III) transport system permease protein [Rhodobacter aestuarii]